MTTATGGMLKHSCMVIEVVFPGLWAWGNDRFSVWGQEVATLLSSAQRGLCSPGACGLEGGGGHEGGQGKGQTRAVQLFRVKGDRLGGEHNDF